MATKHCLNHNDKDVIRLAKAVGLDPAVAAIKIGTYMDTRLTVKLLNYPIREELPFPTEEEFKDYLGIANNSENYLKFKTEQEAALEVDDKNLKTGTQIIIENYENLGSGIYSVKNNENEDIEFVLVEKIESTETPTETKPIEPVELSALDFVFELNPELAKIGTLELYLKYLNTIFPNSKIKGINYHGTEYLQKFEKFDNKLSGTLTAEGLLTPGFWFTYDKEFAQDFGNNVIPVLLNIENPYKAERSLTKSFPYIKTFPNLVETVNKAINEKYDSAFIDVLEDFDSGKANTELVVFKSEQIHILGSNQDIEGFKLFIKNTEIKEVAKDIFNIKDITISNPLDRIYRPQIRADRVNLLAREFSRYLYGILQLFRPNSTKELILNEYGVVNIFKFVKNGMLRNSKDTKTFTDYLREEFEKIVDNFDLIIKETPKLLTAYEGVEIVFVDNELKLFKGLEAEEIPQSLLEDAEGVETDEDENDAVKDGWMIKHRHIDPIQALSQETRRILMSIPKVRKIEVIDGKEVKFFERDDLGSPKYLNPEVAHATLIEKLSGMTTSKLMIPILKRLSVNKPWVTNVVSALVKDLSLHAKFYQDFRKVFMSYWVLIRKKMPDGSYTYMTKNSNKPEGVDYFLEEWRATMESGSMLSNNSLYDEVGNIDRDSLPIVAATIKEMADAVKKKPFEEISKYVEDNIGKIKDTLNTLGIEIDLLKLMEALNYTQEVPNIEGATFPVTHNFSKVLDNLTRITNKLGDSYAKSKHLDFINAFAAEYKVIAEVLTISLDELMRSSIYENKKSYYSFTSPSYMLDLMNKLKGVNYSPEELEQFFLNEYGKFNWFYSNGKYRNSWIKELATNAKSRELFQHKVVLNFNKKEYSKLSRLDHTLLMINEYYSDTKNKVAWYPVFILADAPSAEFVKFHKLTEHNNPNGNWEDTLLDGFYDLAMLEYDRIKIARARLFLIKQGLILPIDNFDTKNKNALKFNFLPFLNDHMDLFDSKLLEGLVDSIDYFRRTLKGVIKENTDKLYEKEFKKYKLMGLFELTDNNKTLKHLQQFSTEERAKEGLRNYFWNLRYAQSLMLLITTTDIAYYKDLGDVQKRMKEIHTPGLRLDTTSKYSRLIENTIFLKDFKSVSNTLKDIELALDGFVKKGTLTVKDKAFILSKYGVDKDGKGLVEVTDAQAYRSLSSYRAIMAMSGSWTTEMLDVFNKLKAMLKGEDVKFSAEDFNVIWQPKKPFMYTLTANHGLVLDESRGIDKDYLIKTPMQNKNAEFLLIFSNILKASPLLTAIEEFMEENEIDVVLFSSAVKVGGLGAIDIHDLTETKAIKDRLLEAISSNVGRYNPLVVHSLPYDDYALVLPVPSHYMDATQGFGTLIRKLVKGDLLDNVDYYVNGKKYNKQLITKLYDDLNVENLLTSFYKVSDKFKDKLNLSDAFLLEVNGSRRSNPELAKAVTIAEDGFPVLPYGDPIHGDRTLSMSHSFIKNEVTKLKTKGGSLVHVTSYGVHDDLNIVWGVNANGEKYIKHIECYMPWYSSEYLQPLIDPKTGLLDIDAVHENILDKNGKPTKVIPEDLRKIIGYRIPTENKYSMFPLYIKGFLPGNSGGAIMLPKEITTIAGLDYDIDKLYVMLPEFNKPVKKYDRNRFVKELMKDLGADPENVELFKNIKNLTYKDNVDLTNENSDSYKIYLTWLKNKENYIAGEVISKTEFKTVPLTIDYLEFIKEELNDKSVTEDNVKLIAEENKLMSYSEFRIAFIENPSRFNTVKARNNMIMDIMWGILTNADTVMNIINPGGFDGLKKTARIINILLGASYAEYNELNKLAKGNLWKYLNGLDLEELNTLADKYKEVLDPLSPSTLTYFHKANHTAGALIGIFANHNANHAIILGTELKLKRLGKTDFAFNLGGERLTELFKIMNAHGLYISRNNSEFVAASVDAVKDPVLSDLNLDTFTADIALYLSRLGHTHGTIGLFLALPVVVLMAKNYELLSDGSKSKRDVVKDTIKDFFGTIKFAKEDYYYKNSQLTQADMTMAIVYGKAIANGEELFILDKYNYYRMLLKIASAFKDIAELALIVAELTSAMRSDTSGGATGPHQADTDLKIINILNLINKSKLKSFPFEGAELIKMNLLNSKRFMYKENKNELRELILNSPIPFVLANHTLGLESSEILLGLYYPFAKESFRYVVNLVNNLTARTEYSKGSLTSKMVKLIYNDLFVYIASELDFFGGSSMLASEERRNYYINEFPDEFERIKNSNKELAELSLINGLKVVNDDKGKKVIVFRNVGSISPNQKDTIVRDWDTMLYMGDEEKLLAKDLLGYSYFRNGFAFGPSSFIHLAPVSVRLAIDGYRLTFTKLNLTYDKKDIYENFLFLYLINHRNTRKLVPEISKMDDTIFINSKGEILDLINIESLIESEINIENIVRIEDSGVVVLYPLIMKRINNKEYYYLNTGVNDYVEDDYYTEHESLDYYTSQYRLIDNPIGIPNKFIEYHNGTDIDFMRSLIDGKYKGLEDDAEDGGEEVPMDVIASTPPPVESKYGNVGLQFEEISKRIKESDHLATNPNNEPLC